MNIASTIFLLIADDERFRQDFTRMLERLGYRVVGARTGEEGLARFREVRPCLVFLDALLPGMDGVRTLRRLRELPGEPAVIMLSGRPETGTVVRAMKAGAADFLPKPCHLEEVRLAIDNVLKRGSLRSEVQRLQGQLLAVQARRTRELEIFFTHSGPMRQVKALIDQVADTDATVLIRGESGVGKGIVALTLHSQSLRQDKPLVMVNCAALPLELLESELFGYEKGAFTGAHRRKLGKFEFAHEGIIFLDEIGEIPGPLQAKLLQVLQDGEFSRLGGTQDIKVNVRVLASSNRDLERAVAQGTFRGDLYYRLNVVQILIPPLRERCEEIAPLADYFREKYNAQYNRQVPPLSPATLARFLAYAWPGNLRELENLVKRIVVLESEEFVPRELQLRPDHGDGRRSPPEPRLPGAPHGLKDLARRAAREAERVAIRQALEQTRWNRVAAARALQISYKALLYKMRQHGLSPSARQ